MRVLILFAGASLALAACGKSDQSGAAQNSTEGLTAEKIVANDVTAIDAVTADSANMAADVNYENLDEVDANTAGNDAAPAKPHSRARPATRPDAAATNATATTTANSAD